MCSSCSRQLSSVRASVSAGNRALFVRRNLNLWVYKTELNLKYQKLGNEKKDCARGCSSDLYYLRKSAERKAHINLVGGTNAFLICALRSADFLRQCLSLEQSHRTISFSFFIPLLNTTSRFSIFSSFFKVNFLWSLRHHHLALAFYWLRLILLFYSPTPNCRANVKDEMKK